MILCCFVVIKAEVVLENQRLLEEEDSYKVKKDLLQWQLRNLMTIVEHAKL